MTPRQRLLAVFRNREPDVIPFVPDLSYYLDAAYTQGRRIDSSAGKDEDYIRFCLENSSIPYYIYGHEPYTFQYDGVEVRTRTQGNRTITEYQLGGRVLTGIREYQAISFSQAWIKYPVESREDLETLVELVGRTVCVPDPARWQAADSRVGERGYPISIAPRSPLPLLFVDWAGVEAGSFLLADEPELCDRLFDAVDRLNDAAFEVVVRGPAPLVHFADNLSGLTVGGLWDRYLAEYYRRRVGQLHAAGKFTAAHLDGTLSGMIRRMARSGLDAIESITPAPVGDLTLEQVERDLEGFNTIIWGGIPGAIFARPFTWPQIRALVDVMLGLHRRGRRVIVASADQVPPDAQIEFVRMIGDYLTARGSTDGAAQFGN